MSDGIKHVEKRSRGGNARLNVDYYSVQACYLIMMMMTMTTMSRSKLLNHNGGIDREQSSSARGRGRRRHRRLCRHHPNHRPISHPVLEATCLSPSYSLQRQMLLSFGGLSIITILIMVVIACITITRAGQVVSDRASQLLREQIVTQMRNATSLISDTLSAYQYLNEGTVRLGVELVRDRIVGYPYDHYEDDQHVPFMDMDTGRNIYPLVGPSVPLDWQIVSNINNNTREEQLQGRWEWAESLSNWTLMSTLRGSFFVQGTCDPEATPGSPTYIANCTDQNNNITNTSQWLQEKSAELSILFKALHEAHQTAFTINVHYCNAGTGATMQYPGMIFDRRYDYISAGCEWMRSINPFTNRSYGTDAEISRCHPEGTKVPYSQYNPMEEDWFAIAALNPTEIVWTFPSKYGAIYDRQHKDLPLLAPVAHAVIDRLYVFTINDPVLLFLLYTLYSSLVLVFIICFQIELGNLLVYLL
jgi:hypothetical protein